MIKGLVTRTEGPAIWVDCGCGDIACVLRGRPKKRQLRTPHLAVV